MKKEFIGTAVVLACFAGSAQQQKAPVVETPVAPVPTISEAEKLYELAVIERENGELKQAIQTAGRVVVLYPQDTEWLPKAELMCAELYIELDLLDAADVTARQVELFHKGTDVAEKATELRSKIKTLKEEMEPKGSAQ
jgi:outer membrane protein assembly factor BamD (BamD/ComL family)